MLHNGAILTLQYVSDIVLISKRAKRTSKCFKIICIDSDFFVNLDKTKVMLFNTTQPSVTGSKVELLLGEEEVAYTQSYTYLRATFIGRFYLWEAISARLTHGYEAFGALERQCACI